MILRNHSLRKAITLTLLTALTALLTACATHKTDWTARIGSYTFDQAVLEFGPPDKQATLQDGTVVAEWLTYRGYSRAYVAPGYYGRHGHDYVPMFPTVVDSNSPDYFLRLIFDPSGRLKDWKNVMR